MCVCVCCFLSIFLYDAQDGSLTNLVRAVLSIALEAAQHQYDSAVQQQKQQQPSAASSSAGTESIPEVQEEGSILRFFSPF